MTAQSVEEKIVFAIAHEGQGDGIPVVVFGVTDGAWAYMLDGKTHTFDLSSLGLKIKVVMFGAATHADAKKLLTQGSNVKISGPIKEYPIKPLKD